MSENEQLDQLLAATKKQLQLRDTGEWIKKEQQMLLECHPKQRAFVVDSSRRVVALTSRGCGKTTGGRKRFLRRMLRTPKARCLFVATTRPAAKDLIWNELKDDLERMEIGARFNETELICTLTKNGSRIFVVGADDKREIEKLRGRPWHEVGIDEGASHDATLLDHLIYRIISPRLGDYGGVLWMVGTPGHILGGPFYEATRPDSKRNPAYSFHYWTLADGAPYVKEIANLWVEAQVEKQANQWSDEHPVWRREYLGQWAADDTENVYKYRPDRDTWTKARFIAGAVVPESFDDRRKGNPFGLPDGHGEWQYVYGMDMGHSDPFALEIFAYSEYDKTLFHVYEFTQKGMYANTIAKHLIGEDLDHEALGGPMRWTGWPSGMVADLSGLGNAIVDDLSAVYGIRIEPAEKKNKHDAIELFNGDLMDGRIKIIQGSRLEHEMLNLQWAKDDFGTLKENKNHDNHCTDAAVYARRKALHHFSGVKPAALPPPGTAAFREREAEIRRKRIEEAEVAQPEVDDWLAPAEFYDPF